MNTSHSIFRCWTVSTYLLLVKAVDMDESENTSLSFAEPEVNTSPRLDSDKSNKENTKSDATSGSTVSEDAVGGAEGASEPGMVSLSSRHHGSNEASIFTWLVNV